MLTHVFNLFVELTSRGAVLRIEFSTLQLFNRFRVTDREKEKKTVSYVAVAWEDHRSGVDQLAVHAYVYASQFRLMAALP